MILLDPTFISQNCDYSFGDQSGHQNGLCQLKEANINNQEFLNKVNEVRKERNWMTLFIDNIRLYKRDGIKYTACELMNEYSRIYKDKVVSEFFSKNDLLELCSQIEYMNFIIFTGFEDTPIDDGIFDKIPENILSIYASNSISFGGKVIPIPYGIKRKLGHWDNSQDILFSKLNNLVEPTGLLYMSHSITNNERIKIGEYFKDKKWATIQSNVNYNTFLDSIKNHKFVICPDGNAIGCECHRDWETLYMKRVPIVKDSEYLREIFDGFPVLFVKDFCDITEDLLKENDYLYRESLNFDISKLDMSILYQNCITNTLKKIN